jgi:hypothetical protein
MERRGWRLPDRYCDLVLIYIATSEWHTSCLCPSLAHHRAFSWVCRRPCVSVDRLIRTPSRRLVPVRAKVDIHVFVALGVLAHKPCLHHVACRHQHTLLVYLYQASTRPLTLFCCRVTSGELHSTVSPLNTNVPLEAGDSDQLTFNRPSAVAFEGDSTTAYRDDPLTS